MLKRLSVENYALIESLELELSDSLNIITGETGAGKSILLGALGLLLGNRADAAAQKDQGRNCIVEGVFAIRDYGLEGFFEENDLEYDPHTVVRRVISAGGKSRSYVNDLPVQQTTLRELGARLIDIHSQHQSLMLGDDGFRIGILDSVAGNGTAVADYRAVYERMRAAERELEAMRVEAERSRKDQEWLEYQVGELRDAKLTPGEQEELEAEQGELSHAEDIKAALASAVSELDADETGILPRLKGIGNGIEGVAAYYPRGVEFGDRLRSTLIELRDIEREFAAEAGRMDSDPERLAAVNDRLAMLYTLQQKHRAASTDELIAVRDGFEARLAAITGGDEAIAALCSEIERLRAEAIRMASVELARAMREVGGDVAKLEGREFFAEYFEPTDKLGADKPNPKSHVAYGFATHVVVIDDAGRVTEVHAAHDSGKVVNPIAIQGQIEGGVLMGLGYALTEDFPLKDCVPQAKFGTLGLMRATDIPDIHAIYVEKEELLGVAYGAKGIGEIATIPTAPAAQGAYYALDGVFRTKFPMENTFYRKPK